MANIDQGREGGFSGVVELAGRSLARSVLGNADQFETLALQFLVYRLPAWQVPGAPSPGGPRQKHDLLAAEIRQTNQVAGAIGQREVRGDALLEEAATHSRHGPEAPYPRRGI